MTFFSFQGLTDDGDLGSTYCCGDMAHARVVRDNDGGFFAQSCKVSETRRFINSRVRTSGLSSFRFVDSREDHWFDASVAKRLTQLIEVAPVLFFTFVTAFGDRRKNGVAFWQSDFCG